MRPGLRVAAAFLLAGFVVAVFALHAVEPRLTPDRHVLSEYARTPSGPLFVVAVLAWSASLLLTALTFRGAVRALLLIAAAGLLLVAAFETQAVAGSVPPGVAHTVGGRLHDIGAGVATLAIFAAAIVLGVRSAGRVRSVCFAVIVLAASVQVGLLAVGPSVGGIRQRLLVLLACSWQAAVLTMDTRSPSEKG